MEEEKYCKENKKILNFFKENKELIITVPAFGLSILGIIYRIIRYYYSLMAEQFYGIPKFYFYDSLQTDYIIEIIFFLAMIMIFLSPLMIKKFLNKSKLKFFESLIYSFFLAYLVFWLSLVLIINQPQLKGYDLILCIVAGIVSWVVYFLVFRNDLSEYSNSDRQKIDKDKAKQKKNIKRKTKEDIIAFAFASIVTVGMIMTFLLMCNSIQIFPEKQKNYEIIEESDAECKVIIGYYKDLAILMNGKIKWCDEEKIRHLEIVRGEYGLESVENKKLEYYRFDEVSFENKQSSNMK